MIWLVTLISFCFAGNPKNGPGTDWAYAEKKMAAAGLSSDFVSSMKQTYEKRDFEQTLELNLLLFLKKSNYHGTQVSNQAIKDVKKFMGANSQVLKNAERDHGVSKSVVASLLWIESRHGKVLGRFHVPSVYIHLLQADRPAVVTHLQKSARYFTHDKITPRIKDEIKKRTARKADWALAELKALEKMHQRDRGLVRKLKGSFAGAFGMSQFIPSSYVHWAVPQKKGEVPDLLRARDAIYSVANYLRDNGWRPGAKATHQKALLHYNNSTDYANAILELAQKAEKPSATPLRRVSTSDSP